MITELEQKWRKEYNEWADMYRQSSEFDYDLEAREAYLAACRAREAECEALRAENAQLKAELNSFAEDR